MFKYPIILRDSRSLITFDSKIKIVEMFAQTNFNYRWSLR